MANDDLLFENSIREFRQTDCTTCQLEPGRWQFKLVGCSKLDRTLGKDLSLEFEDWVSLLFWPRVFEQISGRECERIILGRLPEEVQEEVDGVRCTTAVCLLECPLLDVLPGYKECNSEWFISFNTTT